MNAREFSVTVLGALLMAVGLAVGLSTKDLCGSAFLPAPDLSGGACPPLLDSPRVLGVALLLLGLTLAASPLLWVVVNKRRRLRA